MDNYYIYIYLDPRKSGRYEYGDYCFLYEPFYVGKGKDRRYIIINNRRNSYFKNKINKIRKYKLELIIIKLQENLNEDNSFILESKLIKLIGRKDLGEGPLVNFTNGGEGSSGRIVSIKTRDKISKKNTGKISWLKGKTIPEITRKKMSIAKKDLCEEKHNKFGKKLSQKSKNKISNNHANFKGINNPNHKLTKQDIIEIRKLSDEGILTQKEIGKIFGVDRSTISDIKNNKSWSFK